MVYLIHQKDGKDADDMFFDAISDEKAIVGATGHFSKEKPYMPFKALPAPARLPNRSGLLVIARRGNTLLSRIIPSKIASYDYR